MSHFPLQSAPDWWLSTLFCVALVMASPAHAQSAGGGSGDRIWHLLSDQRKTVCAAGTEFDVDWRLIVGVVIAENELNVGLGDKLQNASMELVLSTKDDSWFRQWRLMNEESARRASQVRMVSNKWPVELWATGYVQSYGPGQITPRTAIAACDLLRAHYQRCRKGTRQIVQNILKTPDFLYLVAAVLRFELQRAPAGLADEIRHNPALWATLYNVGGDYFFQTYQARHGIAPNRFGNFVQHSLSRIELALACG